jgi:hypothetical protein
MSQSVLGIRVETSRYSTKRNLAYVILLVLTLQKKRQCLLQKGPLFAVLLNPFSYLDMGANLFFLENKSLSRKHFVD